MLRSLNEIFCIYLNFLIYLKIELKRQCYLSPGADLRPITDVRERRTKRNFEALIYRNKYKLNIYIKKKKERECSRN